MPLPTLPSPGGIKPPTAPPTLAAGGFEGDDGDGQGPVIPPAPGSLKLSEERLQWLVDYALLRIHEVSVELGRDEDGGIQPGSWLEERDRNAKSYDKDLTWRTKMPNTIFADGMNLTWGASSARVRLLSARIRDTLMGTRPFFGCMTGRSGSADLTKAAESYLQDRIDKTNVPGTIRAGIRRALAIDEAVIKTTYMVDKTPFVGPARSVFVGPDGQPVRTSKGQLVYAKDDVLPDPSVEGQVRLVKDPSFAYSEGDYGIEDFDELEQELVHYEGARSDVMDYRDFGCPLKFDSIHEADINFHLYHKTLGQLGLSYADVEASGQYFSWRAFSRVGAEQPIRMHGEDDDRGSMLIEKVLVAECYIRCQIHDDIGDPREYELMLVLDVDNKKAIFYDYLGNHMSKRPFAVIPGVQKVDGRWYGIGVFTMMAHPDLYTDAQLNRMNEKDSKVASATFFYPNASPLFKNGTPPELGTRQMIPLDINWDPSKPPIFRVNLLENTDLAMELARQVRQAADNEFGIQSAAGASTLDQNRSDTATGITSIERDANLISKDNTQDIAKAIEEVLWQAIEMELEHMDEQVVAFSPDGAQLATLDRDEIRSLDRSVKLLLTKSRSSEMLASNQAAEATWLRFMRLSPREQFFGRPFYVNQLKALEVSDADQRLPEVSKEEMEAWVKAQSQKQEPPKQPSKNISTKYGELARSEQEQVLRQENIQPASPDEIAAQKAQDLASEVTVKQAAPPQRENSSPNTAS